MVDEIDDLAAQNVAFASDRRRCVRIVPGSAHLTYHGGDVINTARVVCIFWGPTWASGGSDSGNASTIQSFRNQLGTSSHYSMLTQYYDTTGNINTTNLQGSQADWFDTTNALAVERQRHDSTVRAEVNRYLAGHGSNNTSTVYEVFLPKYVPGRRPWSTRRRQLHLVRRPRPGVLRLSLQQWQHQVLDRTVPELQRLPGQRLDGCPEHERTSWSTRPAKQSPIPRHRLVGRQRLRKPTTSAPGRASSSRVVMAISRSGRMRLMAACSSTR